MDITLPFITQFAVHSLFDKHVHARFLTHSDLPALIELEQEKWTDVQAASPAQLRARIDTYPDLAVGAFHTRSGRLLASLFMRPVDRDFHLRIKTWQDCTLLPAPRSGSALFGVSLTSRDQAGVTALLKFFWPYALKRGWRHIYLGSPVPGLRDWLKTHPEGHVEDYVHARRAGLPLDPQLRYYTARGFDTIVAIKPDYFPHERSLDYGVLLRGTVPLSLLRPLWAALPLPSIQRIARPLAALL